ncbi:MAG: hypothetical protein IJG07_05655 [Prevotella sp.]|nr:hypothetical protein [Prevotella sp.]
MAKFKGAKWAQILTLMAAIAATIVSNVADAKTYAKDYADSLKTALVAGDVAFTNANFSSDNVGGALVELYTAVSTAASNAAVSISTSTTSSGMLKSYTISQGGTQLAVIDIPKDYVNNIVGIVTQDDSGNSGIFLKVNTAPTGAETPVYEYIDASGLVEYLQLGDQTGKMVTLTITNDHKITADIADGTLPKTKFTTAVQNSLDAADSALQEADFEWATDSEVNTAWANAMSTAQANANSNSGSGE